MDFENRLGERRGGATIWMAPAGALMLAAAVSRNVSAGLPWRF